MLMGKPIKADLKMQPLFGKIFTCKDFFDQNAIGENDNFYAVSMKWDYNRYLIGKSVELFSDGEVGKPLANAADYTLDAAVGLRYKLTDWASLNMKAEKDLVSGSEGELDETRYSLGFGVGW